MNKSPTFRRLLLAPPGLRRSLLNTRMPLPPSRTYLPALAVGRTYSSIPSIASASFWASMIPKPFRKSKDKSVSQKPKSTEWNPATFFIIIFMLIGSMSIQMIALRNGFATFIRRADAKIGLLKEVLGRIQNGEQVDVEGLLGTGDAKREKEWAEVLREIEEEDHIWENSRKPKPKHVKNLDKDTPEVSPIQQEPAKTKLIAEKPAGNVPSGFY